MLDRQLNAVLTVLNDFSDGAYKIIDADEIIAKLSDSDRCTKVELSGIIRTLSDNDYIKVKYSTVDEYCLATLAKARAIEKAELYSLGRCSSPHLHRYPWKCGKS